MDFRRQTVPKRPTKPKDALLAFRKQSIIKMKKKPNYSHVKYIIKFFINVSLSLSASMISILFRKKNMRQILSLEVLFKKISPIMRKIFPYLRHIKLFSGAIRTSKDSKFYQTLYKLKHVETLHIDLQTSKVLENMADSCSRLYSCFSKLKKLHFDAKYIQGGSFQAINVARRLKNLLKLESLHLNFFPSPNTFHNNKFFKFLGHSIARLQNLKNFTFLGESNVHLDQLSKFGVALSSVKKLTHVDFSLSSQTTLAGTRQNNPRPFISLQGLFDELKNLPTLDSLSLSHISKNLACETMANYFDSLKELKTLQTLTLTVIGPQDFDKYQNLKNCLESLPALKNVKFTFKCPDIRILNPGAIEELSKLLAGLKNLENICYDIQPEKPHNNQRTNLLSIVGPFKNLNKLKNFNFFCNCLKDETSHVLDTISFLFNLPSIESFKVMKYVYKRKEEDEIYDLVKNPKLSSEIKSLTLKSIFNDVRFILFMRVLEKGLDFQNLKSFSFEIFSTMAFNNEEFRKILTIINKDSILESINIQISKSTNIKEDSIILLTQKVLALSHIKELKLAINGSAISEGIEVFGTNLSRMRIQSLSLSLDCTKDMSNYCLAYLYKMISRIETLAKLEMNQTAFSLISIFWTDICESLPKLEKLQTLSMNFVNCIGLGEGPFEKYVACLKNMKALEDLRFTYDTRKIVTGKEIFLRSLESLKNLTSLHINIVEKKPGSIYGMPAFCKNLAQNLKNVLINVDISKPELEEKPQKEKKILVESESESEDEN